MSTRPVTIEEQVACVERELRMRRSAYPRWIGAGRLTQAKADAEIAAMEAVLATLQAQVPPPAQGGLL
jgi:hypothetical protein